jgi:hypothetical protein
LASLVQPDDSLIRQFCSSVLTKYVFPQLVGSVMFAVNGCRKQNPFSTSLVVVVVVAAAAKVVVVVAVVVMVAAAADIHDCLYVCIGDGGGGGGGGGGYT